MELFLASFFPFKITINKATIYRYYYDSFHEVKLFCTSEICFLFFHTSLITELLSWKWSVELKIHMSLAPIGWLKASIASIEAISCSRILWDGRSCPPRCQFQSKTHLVVINPCFQISRFKQYSGSFNCSIWKTEGSKKQLASVDKLLTIF